jgi:hypothetical protein
VVTLKPAIEIGRRRDCIALSRRIFCKARRLRFGAALMFNVSCPLPIIQVRNCAASDGDAPGSAQILYNRFMVRSHADTALSKVRSPDQK